MKIILVALILSIVYLYVTSDHSQPVTRTTCIKSHMVPAGKTIMIKCDSSKIDTIKTE